MAKPRFRLRLPSSFALAQFIAIFFRAYLLSSQPAIFIINMQPGINLLRIPLVLLRIVLEDLEKYDNAAFFSFRLISRVCRNASEYLLFRNIVLHDTTRRAKDMSGKLLSRLADTVLGEYLRHLTIGPFDDEEMFYMTISPMFETVLRNTKNLHSVTWNTHRAIHPHVLDLLKEKHPSAKLHIVLRDRKLTSLSNTLLSSPQLHSLDISIYCVRSTMVHGHSELAFIKNCLGTSLKVLRLSMIHPRRPNELRLAIDSHVPALEELTLQYESYDLNPAHCNMWAQITSWHQLQRLDLGMGSPRHLFVALTNRVPNLKYLVFWIRSSRNLTWDLHPLRFGLPALAAFLASINELHDVYFGAHDPQELDGALAVILENTRGSLTRLVMNCPAQNMIAWKPQQYVAVLEQAPRLEYLKANFRADDVEGIWIGQERYQDAWRKYQTAKKESLALPQE